MVPLLPHVIIIFTAFGGVLLASYIRYKKTHHEVLVCPLRSNCEEVTHSEWSTFFGIPIELLGIAYYIAVALAYAAFIIAPALATPLAAFIIFGLSIAAFLFSLYLTFIQAFTLKQWCAWCLTSAGLCTVIFLTALFGTEHAHRMILTQYRSLILIVHMVGLALGLGGATIGDVFFFKFLKDLRISHAESDVLRTISQVIWFGLALLVISGLGLFIPNSAELLQTPKFLVKMIAVSVIILNGAFLNLTIAPKLVHMMFGQHHTHRSGELRHARQLAFALGAISFSSWYSTLLLGFLNNIPLTFSQLFLMYLLIVALAVTGSQMVERLIGSRTMPAEPTSPTHQ